MTYDTVLNLILLLAIPVIVLLCYRLVRMARLRRLDSIAGNPFFYKIDPQTGEISFGDELKNEQVSMLDVLSPDEIEEDGLPVNLEQHEVA
ncbi:MAG: hypothetical protein OEY52_05735 [Gammaproteobacteria bacterium]|nr:hypothetical protein [Gammaproteobacteria bacterium]